MFSKKLNTNVCNRIIHNSSKTETTQMSINWWMDKQNVVHPYHRILCSLAKILSSCLRGGWEWAVARQTSLCMGFPRQAYWSGWPFPSPRGLPDPGIELASPALAGRLFTAGPPRNLWVLLSHKKEEVRYTMSWMNLKALCWMKSNTKDHILYDARNVQKRHIHRNRQPHRLVVARGLGSRIVGHDWATSLSLFTFLHWRRKWQSTPVFLPGESQGRGSLVGCRLWARTELDTTEVT